ncbi:MAG TPA: Gfo/Idh/MocA family oxidoreductase [Planctomycetota bacterium]|jgi:hypothetical protein
MPSRRSFLKAAAAAVAAPYFIPARALGKDGAVPPSERINMGFIGLGGQGSGHLFGGAWTYVSGGYLGRNEVQVQAVCDVWKNKREGAKARVNQHYASKAATDSYKSCECYVDFRDVIARPDIDAVLVVTPAHWHATMSAMAMKAGKDVYCEKPTSLVLAEGRKVAEASARYGRIYQAGTQQRCCYLGMFRRACEYVRNGRLGEFKGAYAALGGGGFNPAPYSGPGKPVPAGLDWELFIGPAPFVNYNGNCGAHLYGWGSDNWGQHHYDICQWAVDGDTTGPTEIDFEEGKLVYRYANKMNVYGCPVPGVKTDDSGPIGFIGSEGRIIVNRERIYSEPAKILEQPLTSKDLRLYKYESHADNFLDCVRSRKAPICPAETGHRAISILLLGGIAVKLGRKLTWDPVKEQFLNDPEADKMLSVAQRPPWQI